MIMKHTSGKLAFAYQTIEKLEKTVNSQREYNEALVKCLNGFVNSCYTGCSNAELDKLRIEAEIILKELN